MTRDREAAGSGDGAARPCIWMTAGLLAYRLCDRDYDCENCPLDAALRRADLERPLAAGLAARGSPPAHEPRADYPGDRAYGAGHCWLQERRDGRLRLGLDRFAARLLAPLLRVIFPAPGTALERGHACCWLQTGARPVPLPAPVGGRLERVNPRVRRDPGAACVRPLDSGWLVEVRPNAAGMPGHLLDAPQARRRAAADRLLVHRLLRRRHGRDPRLGATLADGGTQLTSPREILGEVGFEKLLRRLLS